MTALAGMRPLRATGCCSAHPDSIASSASSGGSITWRLWSGGGCRWANSLPDHKGLGRPGGILGEPQGPCARDGDKAGPLDDAGQGEDRRRQQVPLLRAGRLLVQLYVRVGRRGGGRRATPAWQRHPQNLLIAGGRRRHVETPSSSEEPVATGGDAPITHSISQLPAGGLPAERRVAERALTAGKERLAQLRRVVTRHPVGAVTGKSGRRRQAPGNTELDQLLRGWT